MELENKKRTKSKEKENCGELYLAVVEYFTGFDIVYSFA